jgi:thiamine pyridinylase
MSLEYFSQSVYHLLEHGFCSNIDDLETLNVGLYKYIPDAGGGDDHAMLLIELESQFEHLHPGIDLVLSMAPEDPYNVAEVNNLLNNKEFDIIEVDAAILKELHQMSSISKWEQLPYFRDWHSHALESAKIDDFIYGIPHYMCGYFVFSFHDIIEKSLSLFDMAEQLEELGTHYPNFIGHNLVGGYTLSSIYLTRGAEISGACPRDG